MKRSNINPGNTIVLSNGTVETVYSYNNTNYIVPRGSHYLNMTLDYICEEDLSPKHGCSEIIEIRDCNNKIIWKRTHVELTISEIEKRLGIASGTLRIKK